MANGDEKKTCFVVMGFGEKTDFQSNPQRVLDLNRTFEDIIEPAVRDSGIECVRADQIIHSTVIDKPMYEHLLDADLVIADLSTSNANAIYELGVRHALRPHTTIVIAEKGFAFPFDLSHLSILKYEHLGKEIGYREVMRVRDELKKKIGALIDKGDTDSPVFLFLPDLLGKSVGEAPRVAAAPMAPPQDDKSFAELMETLSEAKLAVRVPADWLEVAAVLNRLKKLQPNDSYIIQQLALATYKSKQPDALLALKNAQVILGALLPGTSSDAETVGLWGAIHKRLWEVAQSAADLDTAIRAYARGYFIKSDYYNGINFAYLLNVRAARADGEDQVADRVLARRTRREVLALCETALASGTLDDDAAFWVCATQIEALAGLGRAAEADVLRQRITERQPPPAQWMIDSMNDQLAKLAVLQP
jgi:Tetratricopeptide Repeats-Sensor